MPTVSNMIPRDARDMLLQYSQEFDQAYALGEVNDWSNVGGLRVQTDALRLRYPIPISAAGYSEFTGDDKFRSLSEVSIDMTSKLWRDGVEVNMRELAAGDILAYSKQPAAMAMEALRHPNVMVAAMLEANPLLDLYAIKNDGGTTASAIRLFAANHPINIMQSGSATFDNDQEFVAYTIPWAKAMSLYFATLKGPNGRPLGLRWTDLLLPASEMEEAKDFFANDLVIQAISNTGTTSGTIVGGNTVRNRFANTINLTIAEELTSTTVRYALALNKGGLTPWPWIVQVRGNPKTVEWGPDSDHAKNTGNVRFASELDMAAGAALPHAIVRLTNVG